jgi:hypothetical protein
MQCKRRRALQNEPKLPCFKRLRGDKPAARQTAFPLSFRAALGTLRNRVHQSEKPAQFAGFS